MRKLTEDSKTKIAPLKTKTRPEFTIKVSPTSMILGGMLLAALIIAAWFFLFKGKSPATVPITPVNEALTRPSLAVVYFENNSGDPNLDNWRSAFSELLATDLSQSKYIRVLRSDQIYSIFKKLNLLEAKKYSTEDLKEIAKKARVNRILKGSYIKAGDNFVITAMLINADTGETISSLSVKAAGENNIFPRVDELTKEIKLKLNIPSDQIADDIDENIGQITTLSAEALKLYIEGRKHHNEGEYSKSIQVMEKAVSIDPQFAMAFRSMAASYGNLGFFFKGRKYLKKAVELSDRLSDRERYLIQGDFYGQTEKTYDKAIKAFKRLLELYPWDSIGNINLGILYGKLGEWDKAIEQLEVFRKNKGQDVFAYLNLAWAYNAKRLFNKSREILKGYLDNFPKNALIHQDLAIAYIYLGKFDLALDEVDKGFSLEPTDDFYRWLKGDIYYFKGDLERTKEEYKKLLDTGGARAVYVGVIRLAAFYLLRGKIKASRIQALQGIEVIKKYGETYWEAIGRQFYAYLLFKSGNFQGALEEFDNMLNIAAQDENRLNQEYALLGKGLTYLEMNLPEQALQAAEELKMKVKNGMNKKRISLYYYLMGAIELKRNNPARAIEYFNKAIAFISKIPISYASFDPPAALIDYLARAYHRNGNLEKARETYEKIALLTYGRMEDGDVFSKSFYHLGKIYQEKGWKGKAIENYNKFIELWKACDPQFQPLVEDARNRVNRLEKEN
ncbi:MAG: tetratricopeptide repeat protein [Candidatus Aminicenantes bacterium]|nr:tetratricopeptide repeat protein [Candidatus Aminicenantes bacterium]NIM77245.1 tetratricopeptide repeat protein [Candidatus Aminicenantes bacterium]NIN16546.1 tetratricopeptide repeat protein [Candidatus Aminicenantes bacterium]NIN40404.1 tetratricopeptide repeat protein [Candidatus Aminicenantes bacterium]NIN83224.1 tetratricopeptide repeat protein [Candidatus Aminicenantes bacterium]